MYIKKAKTLIIICLSLVFLSIGYLIYQRYLNPCLNSKYKRSQCEQTGGQHIYDKKRDCMICIH